MYPGHLETLQHNDQENSARELVDWTVDNCLSKTMLSPHCGASLPLVQEQFRRFGVEVSTNERSVNDPSGGVAKGLPKQTNKQSASHRPFSTFQLLG